MHRNIGGSLLLLALGLCALPVWTTGYLAGAASDPYPYSPANYFTTGLTVFPLKGKEIGSGLSFGPGGLVAFGPDGRSFYTREGRALERFDLISRHASDVPGSTGFGIFSMAVSAHGEAIIVSGTHTERGLQRCGIFKIRLPSGDVSEVFLNPDCDPLKPKSVWSHLSPSPSGEQAVALHNGRLGFLDFVKRTSKPFESPDFWTGAWAPDGKWIAALDNSGKSRLFLIDPSDLSHRRQLGATGGGVIWSPDSRYLLLFKQQLRCGLGFGYFYSMETIEVATGARSIVPSSQCRIQGGASGWVNTDAVR